MPVSVSLNSPGEFLYDDESRHTAGTRWPIWIKNFELFLVGSGVKDAAQKKAILLYAMGGAASAIYYSLQGESDDYEAVKKICGDYFKPLKNLDYEVFMFGQLKQRESESLDDFIIRLRTAAVRCEFVATAVDAEIKKQVISGCRDPRLKKKILAEPGIKLADIQTKARVEESADTQAKAINAIGEGVVSVKMEPICAVRGAKCFACGQAYPHEVDCPAKDKRCNVCGELGHFAASKFCKKKKHVSAVANRLDEPNYLF